VTLVSGWHLPSDAEWQKLIDFVGGASTAGTKLKATSGWSYEGKSGNGTDEFDFSALPGGFGNLIGEFSHVGYLGYWWSATEYDADYAYSRYMGNNEGVYRYNYYKGSDLFSVRCLQD